MDTNTRRAMQALAAALAFTVVTQLAYVGLDAGGKPELGYPIWRTEAVLALVVIAFGFMLVPRQALLGGAIAGSGVFNLLQVGMGLQMFYQLNGEGGPDPAFLAVVGLAFFFYFAAKALLGLAALALGAALWRERRGAVRIVGLLAALAGLVAMATNAAAMVIGMDLVMLAGATGTVATALLALALVPASSADGQDQATTRKQSQPG